MKGRAIWAIFGGVCEIFRQPRINRDAKISHKIRSRIDREKPRILCELCEKHSNMYVLCRVLLDAHTKRRARSRQTTQNSLAFTRIAQQTVVVHLGALSTTRASPLNQTAVRHRHGGGRRRLGLRSFNSAQIDSRRRAHCFAFIGPSWVVDQNRNETKYLQVVYARLDVEQADASDVL